MLRKIVICILAFLGVLVPLALHASEQGSAFASLLAENRVELTLNYDFRQGKDSYKGKATVITQDGCFILKAGEISVYGGTQLCCSVNSSSKEIVLENALRLDLGSNPQILLSALGLDPEEYGVKFSYSPDGMLSAVEAKGDASSMSVAVKSIKKSPKASLEDFSYDWASAGPKWVVTDLR